MADLTPPGERRAPGLRLHKRTMPVQRASAAIKQALIALQSEWDLTDVEMTSVLLDYAGRCERYARQRGWAYDPHELSIGHLTPRQRRRAMHKERRAYPWNPHPHFSYDDYDDVYDSAAGTLGWGDEREHDHDDAGPF